MLFKRLLCTPAAAYNRRHVWPVKQVTKNNFSEAVAEICDLIHSSDFVAVSLERTGNHAANWQKILSIDTPGTAYLKAKHAAERYQTLQFSVCPFSVDGSKLLAHPYNFHLFPRDELKVGMPCYSFSCQSSYLTSMAREGFDFNACIYNGISYLSRAQESVPKIQSGYLCLSTTSMVQCSSSNSPADSLFKQRIKSRVANWIKACKDSNKTEVADALISYLRKIVSGSEFFGSRPSVRINVCTELQVQLVLQALSEFSEVIAMGVPAPGGAEVQAIRVIYTSSEEDKSLLEKELEAMESEQRRRVRGFREVIELISAARKPVLAHNALRDFSFIYSKFIAPLPPTLDEFTTSLNSVFPRILDVDDLIEKIGRFEKTSNLQSTVAFLDSRCHSPIQINIPTHWSEDVNGNGQNVVRLCQILAKTCSILKTTPSDLEPQVVKTPPFLLRKRESKTTTAVSANGLVFLWGFRRAAVAATAQDVKSAVIREFRRPPEENDFDVRMVDGTCAAAVFFRPPPAHVDLLREMNAKCGGSLRAADYGAYRRVCEKMSHSSSSSSRGGLAEALEEEAAKIDGGGGGVGEDEDDWINLDEL